MKHVEFGLATRSDARSRLTRRWDIVILGIVVNACLGTVYSWSVFRGPLEAAVGITAAQSAIPYSIFLGAFAFSMPLAGLVFSRIGPRATLAIGGLLAGIGWAIGGLAEGLPALALGYGIVGGLGVGFGYGVPLAVAGSWFPAKRGLAMGLALAGFGVSPFLTAPLGEVLILSYGVRTAMIALGVGFAAVVGGLAVFFVEPEPEPESEAAVPLGGAEAERVRGAVTSFVELEPREMLRSRSFFGLWGCYVIGTLAGLTAIGMTAGFGVEAAGLSAPAAAAAVAAFGVLNGVGRPLFGALHDRLGTRHAIVLSFALIAVGGAAAFAATFGVRIGFFVGFGVFWLMLGGWLAIAPAATTRLFGARNYKRNYGIMYTAYGVGALVGGGLSGALLARFGTYRPLFIVIIGLCAAGIALAVVFLPAGRARA